MICCYEVCLILCTKIWTWTTRSRGTYTGQRSMYCCIQFTASMACALENGKRVNWVERKRCWMVLTSEMCNAIGMKCGKGKLCCARTVPCPVCWVSKEVLTWTWKMSCFLVKLLWSLLKAQEQYSIHQEWDCLLEQSVSRFLAPLNAVSLSVRHSYHEIFVQQHLLRLLPFWTTEFTLGRVLVTGDQELFGLCVYGGVCGRVFF